MIWKILIGVDTTIIAFLLYFFCELADAVKDLLQIEIDKRREDQR